MPEALYKNLSWMPPAPKEFKALCQELTQAGDTFCEQLRHLSQHSLNTAQIKRLEKIIMDGRDQEKDLSPLIPFKLGLVSNATTDLIAPALVVTGIRHGLLLEIHETSYDQTIAETLNPESDLYAAQPDTVLLALDYRALPLKFQPNDTDGLIESKKYLHMIIDNIKNVSKANCIIQNFAPPPEHLFGSLDTLVPGTPRHDIDALNSYIANDLISANTYLVDIAGLAQTVGLHQWFDPVHWHMGKLPFSQNYVPLYADHICRLIAAMKGKSRRCLVLDLDNTLWGGILGDDGIEGVTLGQGDGLGEAFVTIQQTAKDLRHRGIILAVSSKNEDSYARQMFREHPDMILQENDITIFQANWQDKASNLKSISDALNIGLDTLVFLDDNPAERALVRQTLPEVAVPELPDDPSYFPRYLSAGGYFEAVNFSSEDLKRADYYQSNAQRVELQQTIGDYESYLRSLEMVAIVAPFDALNRARITQLINKSNQFNLTTIRYTEQEVEQIENSGEYFTLQVRLKDKFGDNGLISVVICKKSEKDWTIDTWLMSCRVLKRRLEEIVLKEIAEQAVKAGAESLTGLYKPTERNAQVRTHYQNLGFDLIAEEDTHATWRLALENYQAPELPFIVEQ